MSNYLPAGADNDPNAPWNIDTNLCKNCNSNEVYAEAFDIADKSNLDISEVFDEINSQLTLCDDCVREELADEDNDDDWASWK